MQCRLQGTSANDWPVVSCNTGYAEKPIHGVDCSVRARGMVDCFEAIKKS